ncbi:hypothetical protein SCA6_014256 [Theobroma cacao]
MVKVNSQKGSPKYPALPDIKHSKREMGCQPPKFRVEGNPMDSSETCLMEDQSPEALLNCEEIPDNFVCCVCLDLLYKPIVMRCGHIACFWCVQKSMSSRYESHCPICRNPYSHFPGICQMLHFLLLKLFPITCKKRADEILDEEKKAGYFSPEFNSHACELHADGEFNYLRNPAHSSAMCFRSSSYLNSHATSKDNLCKTAGQVESHDNDTIHTKQNSDRDLSQIKPVARQEKEQVSVADLLCAACKQLLFRPVILNCGHGLHPRGIPKVCLTLDQFLAAKFPKEYALSRDAVQLKQVSSKHERATTCSLEAGKQDFSPLQLPSRDHPSFSVQPGAYIHIRVGCDACGVNTLVPVS